MFSQDRMIGVIRRIQENKFVPGGPRILCSNTYLPKAEVAPWNRSFDVCLAGGDPNFFTVPTWHFPGTRRSRPRPQSRQAAALLGWARILAQRGCMTNSRHHLPLQFSARGAASPSSPASPRSWRYPRLVTTPPDGTRPSTTRLYCRNLGREVRSS